MRLLVLSSALILCACASITEPFGMRDPFEIPQPFRGKEQNRAILAQVMEAPSVLITEAEGLEADEAKALSARLETVARAHDVVAVLQDPPFGAWTLKAVVVRATAEEGPAVVKPASVSRSAKAKPRLKPDTPKDVAPPQSGAGRVLAWSLIDDTGRTRNQFEIAVQGSLTDASVAGDVAERTAARLSAALSRDQAAGPQGTALSPPGPAGAVSQPAPAPQPKAPAVAIMVGAITGAPGDGNKQLARAIAVMLGGLGMTIAEPKTAGAYRVDATIAVETAQTAQARDIVILQWRVISPKGIELGIVSQRNGVKPGSLARVWGETAALAAAAAAPGIAAVISEARTKGR